MDFKQLINYLNSLYDTFRKDWKFFSDSQIDAIKENTQVDNVTGTSPVMGIITTTSACIGEWDYSLAFNTGLILITTGNSLDATIVYE